MGNVCSMKRYKRRNGAKANILLYSSQKLRPYTTILCHIHGTKLYVQVPDTRHRTKTEHKFTTIWPNVKNGEKIQLFWPFRTTTRENAFPGADALLNIVDTDEPKKTSSPDFFHHWLVQRYGMTLLEEYTIFVQVFFSIVFNLKTPEFLYSGLFSKTLRDTP